MRILLLTEMCPPDSDGGAEVNAEKIAVGLRKIGHDVHIVTGKFRSSYAGSPDTREWVHRILEHGPLLYEPKSKFQRVQNYYKFWKEVQVHRNNREVLRQFLSTQPFDVAYAFGMSRIGLSVLGAVQDAGLGILWHQGGNNLENRLLQEIPLGRVALHFRNQLRDEANLDLRCLAYVSQFLIDDSTRRGFIGKNGRGSGFVSIIPRGIEFPVRTDVARERASPPVLLMAGRISPIKGFHHAIEAVARVHRQHPDLSFELHIVGEAENADVQQGILGSEYIDQLREQIAANGLDDRVKFLGRKTRSELLDLMASATAFISASICGEAFANTIIETLGSGTPLLVSNDGSALEVVRDGVSALVHERDDVDKLAANITRVLTESELTLTLARGGADRIQEAYTLDRIMEITQQTLQKTIDFNAANPYKSILR